MNKINHNLIQKTLIKLIVLFGICPLLSALDPQKPIESCTLDVWTIEHGLPQNSILCIAQSPQGYLWLGTRSGLARFDGIKFDVFTSETISNLKNNIIRVLMFDKDGTLWIGTQGGGVTLYKNGRFKIFSHNKELSSANIWTFLQSVDGSIWIGTDTGLNRFWQESITPIPFMETNSPPYILKMIQDFRGEIWIATENLGLFKINFDQNQYKAILTKLNISRLTTLYEDRQGKIWLGTKEHGLKCLQELNNNKPAYFKTLAHSYIISISEDRQGTLWIGTFGDGIFRINDNKISVFNTAKGLSSNNIFIIYEDKEESLWIGTESGGLNRLRDTKITTYSSQDNLSHNILYGIMQDRQGNIWIGTGGFGVNRYQNGIFTHYTTADGLANNAVITMTQGKNNDLWFGSYGGGVSRYKKNGFTIYSTKQGLHDNFVMVIYADKKDNIWVGTEKGGLNRFANGRFVLEYKIDSPINFIFEDSRYNLYVGTFGSGLMEKKNGIIRFYNQKNGFPSNTITTMFEDSQGMLWLGSADGLIYFQPPVIKLINKKQGLPHNMIYSILEDGNDRLWMSCNQGLFSINRTELKKLLINEKQTITTVSFGKEYGLKSLECTICQPAGWRTKDGKLWYPTTQGVAVVDPTNLQLALPACQVVIEKVTVDKTNYYPDAKVIASNSLGNIEIQYTAPTFVTPGELHFKYMLEGYNNKWIDARNRRTAFYTNIPPGIYRFKIKVESDNNLIPPSQTALDIELKSPSFRKKKWLLYWFF